MGKPKAKRQRASASKGGARVPRDLESSPFYVVSEGFVCWPMRGALACRATVLAGALDGGVVQDASTFEVQGLAYDEIAAWRTVAELGDDVTLSPALLAKALKVRRPGRAARGSVRCLDRGG
jgi:hypothetical protein